MCRNQLLLAGLSTGSVYFLTVPSDHTVSKDGNIIPKKRINCGKCDFATKQHMFGAFAIDEILCYRGI